MAEFELIVFSKDSSQARRAEVAFTLRYSAIVSGQSFMEGTIIAASESRNCRPPAADCLCIAQSVARCTLTKSWRY